MDHTLRALTSAALLAAVFFAPERAHAIPVSYQMVFQVVFIDGSGPTPPSPEIALGNQYFGSFTVDDALLAADGANQAGTVFDFLIQIEDLVWDFNNPSPGSAFAGFRGPAGLGSSSPGFDVLSGEIVNLRGGVYGSGDFPYIDFSRDITLPLFPDDPACSGTPYCGNSANNFWTRNPYGAFGGSMSIARTAVAVAEPATWALAAIALLSLALRGFCALPGSAAFRSRTPSRP